MRGEKVRYKLILRTVDGPDVIVRLRQFATAEVE
jgi:hypothetical protein